jgi:hypothetical protein
VKTKRVMNYGLATQGLIFRDYRTQDNLANVTVYCDEQEARHEARKVRQTMVSYEHMVDHGGGPLKNYVAGETRYSLPAPIQLPFQYKYIVKVTKRVIRVDCAGIDVWIVTVRVGKRDK